MKICRFNDDRLGLVEGEDVVDVTAALEVIPTTGWPAPQGDALITKSGRRLREGVGTRNVSGERLALSDVVLKSPVANPTKVIGAPVNYYAHLDESQEDEGVNFRAQIKTIDHYGLFLKNPTLVGAGDGVDLHFTDRRNDHEVEVSMIIGKTAKNVLRKRP